MVIPVEFAPPRQQAPEPVGAAEASKTSTAPLWVLGLAAAATAINLTVCKPPPPPGLGKNTYYLAISGAFFAGVAGVMAAVWLAHDLRDHHAHGLGKKLMNVLLAQLAALNTPAALAVLGLAAATTAINLTVCKPPLPLGLGKNTYYLVISGAFFAGVAGVVMAAVWLAHDLRNRHATGVQRKFMYASLAELASVVCLTVGSLLW